jgi:4-alpha-glucanotransferase
MPPTMSSEARELGRLVAEALDQCGVRRLVLAVHDASFPAGADDLGRGSPYSAAAEDFLGFVRELGFTGVQLGPPGQTTLHDPSPYDGAAFSRSEQSVAVGRLPGVPAALLAELCAARPPAAEDRVDHGFAWQAQAQALDAAWTAFRTSGRAAELAQFRARSGSWLVRDGVYAALSRHYGSEDFATWPAPDRDPPDAQRLGELARRHAEQVDRHSFGQWILARQHQGLRAKARALELKLYGDLQTGLSLRDRWALRPLFLPGYWMGAPPSRTNPQGQPWGYPVFDPRRHHQPGGPLAQLRERVDRMLGDYDGLRIDHPHGLVCPWVYRADNPDALAAVQAGARLHASPDLPDHPALAELAIARADQLAAGEAGGPRWADNWVERLEPAQVDRYALLLDAVVERARAHGRDVGDLVCEVLSTWPYPLRRVMARHKLGCFRIAQKANLAHPADVYRAENAQPPDWVMLGNHDTPPIWLVIDRWRGTPRLDEWATHLARRLERDQREQPALAARLLAQPERLAEAMLADLVASRAQNVMVFFPDLLGMQAVYNRPGTFDPGNWTLRVPHDYARLYHERSRAGRALSLPRVLALALRARGGPAGGPGGLAERLERGP